MRGRLLVAAVVIGGMFPAAAANAVESPPTGTHPSEFARVDQGCLGPLRSQIARGEFAGVGPFGEHFTGDANPGAHQGTVGEEEFISGVLGIGDVESFCDQF